MDDTQSTDQPYALGIFIPDAGAKLSDLLGGAMPGRNPIIRISGYLPGSATARPALVITTPRINQEISENDYSNHGKYVPAGEDWYEPNDNADQFYIKPYNNEGTAAQVILL